MKNMAFLFGIFFCLLGFHPALAEERHSPEDPARWSIGSRTVLESQKSGGGAEILYTPPTNSSFRIGLTIEGYAQSNWGFGRLGLKLIWGGPWNDRFRSYGFLNPGIILAGNPDQTLQGHVFFGDLSGGGGAEILLYRNLALFLECGGGGLIVLENYTKDNPISGGYAHLAIGFRRYW